MPDRTTPKINYKRVGKQIRRIREAAGLSQEELGRLCGGLSGTAFSLYEQGERRINLETLSLVAEVLKVNLKELVEGYTENTPSIRVALRADKELGNDERTQKQILEFIGYIKEKRRKNGKA